MLSGCKACKIHTSGYPESFAPGCHQTIIGQGLLATSWELAGGNYLNKTVSKRLQETGTNTSKEFAGAGGICLVCWKTLTRRMTP